MKILSNRRYNSLLRAANERLSALGKNEYNQNLTEVGMLIWRLDPNRHNLRPNEMWQNPFEHLAVVEIDTKVVIFLVHHGEPLLFNDTKELFPSDELVAKLRMLLS